MVTSHLTASYIILVSFMGVVAGCNPSISPTAKQAAAQIEQPWWRTEQDGQQEQQEVEEVEEVDRGKLIEQPGWRTEQDEQEQQEVKVDGAKRREQPWWRTEQDKQEVETMEEVNGRVDMEQQRENKA